MVKPLCGIKTLVVLLVYSRDVIILLYITKELKQLQQQ